MSIDIDAWIRQYAEWCLDRIEEVIVGEKLHAQLLRVIRGPVTITFQVRLLKESMNHQAMARMRALGPVFAQALQTESVRIQNVDGAIAIELALPEVARKTPNAKTLAKHTRGATVCLGLDSCRQPVTIDVRQHGVTLWVGPSRSGKTQSMKTTLYALLESEANRALRFVVFAQKLEDWEAFAPAAGCWGIYSDASQALDVVEWVASELERRAREKRRRPAILIIADDLINLLKSEPGIGQPLGAIASMGAGLGVHLFVGTQEAGSKRGTGDNSVENNVTARIIYRIANAQAASRSAGQGKLGVEALSGGKGDGIFVSHGEKRRVATGYVENALIAKLPQGSEVAPWDRLLEPVKPSEPAKTGQNRQKPGELANSGGIFLSDAAADRAGVTHTATAPVSELASVLANFPIELRAPNADERRMIRIMAKAGMSKNQIIKAIYSPDGVREAKNAKTMSWVNAALAEPDSVDEIPERVGRPEASQQVLRMLLDEGVIDWRATAKANAR